jgi:ADP-ribose pyrophosphatase YjhB (NUDIX family)
MTSVAGAAEPSSAWTVQRVEVYVDVSHVGGAPGGAPGAVLGHGERPRDAALRALTGAGLAHAVSDRESLHLVRVLSDVRPMPGSTGHPGLHVLRLLFASSPALGPTLGPTLDPTLGPTLDPTLGPAPALCDPLPAPVTDAVPGAPMRVQRPGAYAVVVREGHVLLTRLANTGVWTLPGGGIDHGEHPDETIHREAFEEAGVHLSSIRLVDADSRHFTGRNPHLQVDEDFHGVRLIYRAEVTHREDPVVQEVGGSTDAAAWVPLAALGELHANDLVRSSLARLGVR